ncbi:RHS repeat-associated core domain-containing protein [Pseudomonas sp. P5_152]|uniref:RHS repeat-associated core domain-containing protein n=1 Tax=unclassified Pseudomonas TaxID=196821 RepID=UPI001356ED15|nr:MULTISPECIES: RHS repeat-associated core domain-containing protein [unclassified Pseudomonas]MDX9665632.1 RHS repeat-associated core domain-containing protein [Pseudomonas sp. P5_152]
MPSSSRLTELCRYHYDPLDRQAACTLTLLQPATLQRFYCTSRLATEIHGAVRTSLFQHDDHLLAQQRHQNDQLDTTLLATDQQRTVLSALDTTRPHPLAYTPYGHRPAENGLLSLLGFNGQRPDPVTGHYHLGNGYRQFNPVLMRFNSPDSWSPFGQGGLNAYGYCDGEPVLGSDPMGHSNIFRRAWKGIKNMFGRTPGKTKSSTSGPIRETQVPATISSKSMINPDLQHSTNSTSTVIADTRDPELLRRLNNLKGTSTHPTSSRPQTPNTVGVSSNDPQGSQFENSVAHSNYTELAQLQNAISKWPATSAEGDSMLTIIKGEMIRRFPQFYGNPPKSNRTIREGEPGYRKK